MRLTRRSFAVAAAIAASSSRLGSQQVPDSDFNSDVREPAFRANGPRVSFDIAHHNILATTGRMDGFVQLLRNDGCRVVHNAEPLTRTVLGNVDVLAISPPFDPVNPTSAYTNEECSTVQAFVSGGGSLLLMADHSPADQQVELLAKHVGVALSKGVIGDGANYDRSDENPRAGETGPDVELLMIFSRSNGLLRDHPITRGRSAAELVRRVAVFGGSSLIGPKEASTLLALAPTATNRQRERQQPVGLGTAQALAFSFGKGRVVVTGDGTMFTAQRLTLRNRTIRLGMSRSDLDNRQLALNTMRWLSGSLT